VLEAGSVGLYESVGKPLFALYGYADEFATFQGQYNEWGAWIVFIAGVTPFPYKVITIASGATGLDIWTFLIASLVSRGLIFGVIAGLLYAFGRPIRGFIERRLGVLALVFGVLVVGGFVALRFLL